MDTIGSLVLLRLILLSLAQDLSLAQSLMHNLVNIGDYRVSFSLTESPFPHPPHPSHPHPCPFPTLPTLTLTLALSPSSSPSLTQ